MLESGTSDKIRKSPTLSVGGFAPDKIDVFRSFCPLQKLRWAKSVIFGYFVQREPPNTECWGNRVKCAWTKRCLAEGNFMFFCNPPIDLSSSMRQFSLKMSSFVHRISKKIPNVTYNFHKILEKKRIMALMCSGFF